MARGVCDTGPKNFSSPVHARDIISRFPTAAWRDSASFSSSPTDKFLPEKPPPTVPNKLPLQIAIGNGKFLCSRCCPRVARRLHSVETFFTMKDREKLEGCNFLVTGRQKFRTQGCFAGGRGRYGFSWGKTEAMWN
ncbi:hypothetical protein KM043_017121 [Ampulex compressa]|nr:hypothetical protein KM043_017121 [Ampulex compressa]